MTQHGGMQQRWEASNKVLLGVQNAALARDKWCRDVLWMIYLS